MLIEFSKCHAEYSEPTNSDSEIFTRKQMHCAQGADKKIPEKQWTTQEDPMASDEKPIIDKRDESDLQKDQETPQASFNRKGCLSTLGEGWTAAVFTLLSSAGVILYSLSISIVADGQKFIHSDVYPVTIFGSLWPCVSYILIAICIKFLSFVHCTSSDTCNITLRQGHPCLILAAGCINVFAFVMKLFGGLPERTPQHLQVILFSLTLPAAVMWRYIVRRVSKCVKFFFG